MRSEVLEEVSEEAVALVEEAEPGVANWQSQEATIKSLPHPKGFSTGPQHSTSWVWPSSQICVSLSEAQIGNQGRDRWPFFQFLTGSRAILRNDQGATVTT